MAGIQTAYTMTQHCQNGQEVVRTLADIGLGRAVIADECRKIAAANGPKAAVYREAMTRVYLESTGTN